MEGEVVLVTGSRSITDPVVVWSELAKYSIRLLVHGAAVGTDTLAAQYAADHQIEQHPFPVAPADYTRYGRIAPLLRNTTMVEFVTPLQGIVLAFWRGPPGSTLNDIWKAAGGTADCARKARRARLQVSVIFVPSQ